MNRRDMLAAPLALAAFLAPTNARASSDSEILALFARWQAMDVFAGSRGITDAEFSEAEDLMGALKSRILALPASTAPELAAKVLLVGEGQDLEARSVPSVALWLELQILVGGQA